jgi:hypothetical protein
MSYVFDNSASVAFAIIISIFAVSVNFLWQRQEVRLQYEWDMVREREKLTKSINFRVFFIRQILQKKLKHYDRILNDVLNEEL